MKITNFADAFSLLMKNEGGFTCDKEDPGNWTGGAVGVGTLEGTMFGVTCVVARENGFTGSMKYLPLELAESIAKKKYWDPLLLDQIDPEIAFQVLDANYNGGHAVKWLQKAALTTDDEVMGPGTIAAVNAQDKRSVIMRFDALRIKYLNKLKIWPSFGKGWMERISDNLWEGAD